jgi:hypothetical protein
MGRRDCLQVNMLLTSFLLQYFLSILKCSILCVLYGCETWSLTLREEHTLKVNEKRMLRKINVKKSVAVTGSRRKLHNEELHKFRSLPSIIRMLNSRRMR